MTESLSLSKGDILVLICAFCFSFHYYGGGLFFTKSRWCPHVLHSVFHLRHHLRHTCMLTESPNLHAILTAWQPILYAGVLSRAIGYTLQIVAQKIQIPLLPHSL